MKNYFLLILVSLFINSTFSQTVIEMDTISPGNLVAFDCVGANLYDSGGNSASYSDNENLILIICPDGSSPGYGIFSSMLQMDIASGDQLNIYNGVGTGAPLFPSMPLDENTSYNLNAQFQASTDNVNGCLTFEFISNNDGIVGDFDFNISCQPKCQTFYTGIGYSVPDTTLTPTDIYFDLCLGDTLTVGASNDFPNTFPNPLAEYNQSNALSTFEWYWDQNTTTPEMGQYQSHYYDTPGGYIGKLISYDDHGCRSYQDYAFKVRVAQPPSFIHLSDSILCFEESETLFALPEGTIVGGQVVQGDTVYFIPPVNSGDSIFLPDGNGAIFESIVQVSGFENNATIQNCSDILEVCINMEHSFLGDLRINLICPNGNVVALKTFSGVGGGGGGTFLGNPIDDPSVSPGAPLEYCFSYNTNGFLVDGPTEASTNTDGITTTTGTTISSGLYQPVTSMTNFIGCDINGPWTLEIHDSLTIDDGYIFDWGLRISPCMYPDVDSFLMIYDFGYWEADSDIVGTTGTANEIIVTPSTAGLNSYIYHTADQFGCEYEATYDIWVDSFVVDITPVDATLCSTTDSVDLSVDGLDASCIEDYTFSQIPLNMIGGGTGNITLGDDAVSSIIPIPFNFDFYCEEKNSFVISSNGFISFNISAGSFLSNNTIPEVTSLNDFIALMWNDLNPNDGGTISEFVTGTAPNRIQVIEFNGIHHFGDTETVTGQIQLFETSNIIEIHLQDCQLQTGETATMGIENETGALGASPASYNNLNWTASNEAWRFVPESIILGFSFNWTPNFNISSISDHEVSIWPGSSYTYSVDVVSNNDCHSSDTIDISITPLITTISNDTAVCPGETVNLLAGGADTYSWSPSLGLDNTNTASVLATPLLETTYYVTYSTPQCSKIDSVLISMYNGMTVLPINNGLDTVSFCENSFIDLSVDDILGYTYSWSPVSGNTYTVTVNEGGNYSVDYSNGDCDYSSSIYVEESPLPDFNLPEFILCCDNDTINIEFSDIISNFESEIQSLYWNGILITDTSKIYYSSGENSSEVDALRIINYDGCENVNEITVSTKCANPSFTHPDTIFANTSEVFNLTSIITNATNTTYSWTTTDISTNAITDNSIENATFNGIDAGNYSAEVTVTNYYGSKACPETTENTYEVVGVTDPLYPDAFTPYNDDEVNKVFRPIISEFAIITEFRIYNRWGKMVYNMETANNKNGWDGRYKGELQKMDAYTYYATVKHPDKIFVQEGVVTLIR